MVSNNEFPNAGMNRRNLIKTGAVIATSNLLPLQVAFGGQETDALKTLRVNVDKFREAAIRRQLIGPGKKRGPPLIVVEPPASEAEVLLVERQIGEPLPNGLRNFYTKLSAGINIQWFMPGRWTTNAEGLTGFEIDGRLLPPLPFQREERPYGGAVVTVPTILGGHMTFSLKRSVAELSAARSVAASFREAAAQQISDADLALHYTRHAEWWERGFPLGLDGGGNLIAVDRQDNAGRMMWLSHTGAGEPGWFLEHDLPSFMLIQSRLGFPGFGEIQFGTFSDTDVEAGDREMLYIGEHPDDEKAGLWPPSTYRIDDESDEAKIWRDWLGLKQG